MPRGPVIPDRPSRLRERLRGANVTPAKKAQMPNVTPAAAANVTPGPTPDPGPPPNTVSITLDFPLVAIDALRDRGFLAAGPASPDDIAVAVFAMLGAAWRAGVISDAQDETKSKPSTRGGVPFMITAAMKQQLLELGYTDVQIREMQPAEAHQIINTA
jgi:hypothetical protein